MLPAIAITAVTVPSDGGHDHPVTVHARSTDGRLVGSALARRAAMAIAYFEAREQGMLPVDYESELDSVAFLEHVEVAESERGQGIATALLAELEALLAARGARVLFGGIGRGDDSVAVAGFFERRGFQVLQPGQPLPGFFGRRWTLPHTAEPQNWVFARLPRK